MHPAPRTRRTAGLVLVAGAVLVGLLVVLPRGAGAPGPGSGGAAPATAVATSGTSAPATLPPAPEPTSPTTAPAPAATTLPRSPLAALVGVTASAVPPTPVAVDPPVQVRIDAVDVDAPVRPVGVLADGQLELPGATEVGWYRLGSAPGTPGSTVLAAHVAWQGEDGPFVRLDDVEVGDEVEVQLAGRSVHRYEVVRLEQVAKAALPPSVWALDGPEALVLITCGGAFDRAARHYEDNVVVHAVPRP